MRLVYPLALVAFLQAAGTATASPNQQYNNPPTL